MKRTLPPLVVLLSILVAMSCSPNAAPTAGAKAPDFELSNTAGQTVRLSDYLGRPVAVNFWGIECVYCVEEMPDLQKAFEQESTKTDGVAWITVNVQDSLDGVRAYFADKGYTLPALADSRGQVAQAYGISAIPITFLIDREGIVRYVKRGMFLSINEINVALNRIR